MARHWLECMCGRKLAVEIGQAGETIPCECGNAVAVPTLRQLRQLPLAGSEAAAANKAAWGVRQGATAVGLIAAAVCLSVAGWSRLSEPTLPEFNATAWEQFAEQDIASLTPAAAWQRWIDRYGPLRQAGFTPLEHPETASRQQTISQQRLLQTVMIATAAVCGAVAAGVWLTSRRAVTR